MRKRGAVIAVMLLLVAGSAGPALAQAGGEAGSEVYAKSLAALTMLLVTAVLLESAFATIFNWRVFLTYFSARGVKTIVMIAVALLVVNYFSLDVFASLIAVYRTAAGSAPATVAEAAKASGSDMLSKTLTALILAGGSAGVYNVMAALGFRQRQENVVEVQPPRDEAWIAVRVVRRNSVGEIRVNVEEVKALPAGAGAPPAIAGTIGFRRPSLAELLLRNRNRFPANGGYVVKPGVPYIVQVEGRDAAGTTIRSLHDRYYVFAPRAIVDFDVVL